MVMPELILETRKIGAGQGVQLIRPNGLIDIITSPELDSCINRLIEAGLFRIIIDMSGTTYISSAGWGIFIGSLRSIRENGGDIVFINMPEAIRDFFTTLKLESKFSFFENQDDALAFFESL